MEEEYQGESWIVVKYFVKLTTWFAAMKPDLTGTGSNAGSETAEEIVEKTFEELLNDFEWVRSPKEELAIKISYENALRIERELQELQSTASSIKLRQYFFRKCTRFMASLTEEDRKLLQTVLDAPKRSAIIKAAIKSLEQPWLEFIREKFFLRPVAPAWTTTSIYSESPVSSTELESPFSGNLAASDEIATPDTSPDVTPSSSPSTSPPSWPPQTYRASNPVPVPTYSAPLTTVSGSWEVFANSYQEQSYQKNIAGSMASVGFQASHGAVGDQGLTPRILGDIVWSVFSTLSHAICQTLKRDSLDAEDMKALARRVLSMKDPLVRLWIQTIRNSRVGSQNEGRLIAKWREEEEKEKQRILEIKRRGADARFYDEERKQKIAAAAKKRKLRGDDLLDDFEEEFSVFNSEETPSNGIRIIEDYQPHPQRDDFIKAKRLLEATLFGRGLPLPNRKKEEPALPKVRVEIDMSESMSIAPSQLASSMSFIPSTLISSTTPLTSSSMSLESSTSSRPSSSPLASSAIPPMCSISPSIQRLTDSFFVC
eukprot:TRINITY_DN562_c0_g1_i1.p1 TRINITY_DN562_c0_g1~~TRINITY_DN562_c0_g1_i1.p1  ORF type:complete len:542 (+),score=107.25 TRINITY_DN562_c0_g1_i1:471-2096(+)